MYFKTCKVGSLNKTFDVLFAEMESSRPWPWPRGASRTTGHVLGLGLGLGVQGLGLGGQVLGLGLGRHVLGLGLGKHVLGPEHFRLMCLPSFMYVIIKSVG